MKSVLHRSGIPAAAGLLLLLLTGCAACHQENLASGGKTSYTIVVPDEADTGNRFASTELRHFLKEATGVDFEIVPSSKAPEKNRIFLGLSGEARKVLGTDPLPDMKDQEFRVRTAGNDLLLFGKGTWGDMFAVYDYLENVLGFRWYDGRGGTKVPDCRELKWQALDRKGNFSVKFRAATGYWIFYRPQAHLAFLRNRQNFQWLPMYLKMKGIIIPEQEETLFPGAHTLPSYIPGGHGAGYPPYPWLKNKNYWETNPEFFGMRENGKRAGGTHLCFSCPGLRKELTANILEHMRRTPDRQIFSVNAHDSPGRFCNCPECLALEKEYKTRGAAYFLYLIELAKEVEKQFPKNRIAFLVYRKDQTQKPPSGIERLPANLLPIFAPIDDDFSKPFSHKNNEGTLADLKRWGDISSALAVWYYPNPYGGSITFPLGNIRRLVKDVREAVRAGMTHSFFEHDVGVANMIGFTELQSFLILQLMKDVTQDPEALIREFMAFEYGKAAPLMMKYLDELEAETEKSQTYMEWNASHLAYTYLTPENLVRWYGYFLEMEKLLADSPVQLYNLKRVKINLERAILCRYNRILRCFPGFKPDPEPLADSIRSVFEKTTAEFYDKDLAFRAGPALRSVNDQLDMYLIQAGGKEGKPLPEEIFAGIPKERIFQTVPATRGRAREKDPDAAWGVAAVQMKTPVPKLPYPVNFYDLTQKKFAEGIPSLTQKDLGPRGQYKIYKVAEVTLTPGCEVSFGESSWYSIRTSLGEAYEPGSLNQVTIYASLKFEGPAFYPEDEGKADRVLCDRVIVVRKPDLQTE